MSIMFKLATAALLLLPSLAFAQPAVTHIAPLGTAGQGILTATTTSQSMVAANVTTSPGSVVFPAASAPLPNRDQLFIANQGAVNVSICWHGGTATATNCYVLAAGASRTVELPDFAAVRPSIIAASSTAAVELEW
jgi:hypothetical protein